MCLLQLACLTACAKSLAEPEDEILSLDGLHEASDEAEKAQQVSSDPHVEHLRVQLLTGIRAVVTSFPDDLEVSTALSDFIKACTSTNLSTPVSLDPLALFEIVSQLVQYQTTYVWLSIASLLVFRLGKRPLDAPNGQRAQLCIESVLLSGVTALRPTGCESTRPLSKISAGQGSTRSGTRGNNGRCLH